MSDTQPRRTKTPPDLKWLLNERAALVGTVEKATAYAEALSSRLERAEKRLLHLKNAVGAAQQAVQACESKVAALSRTLSLAYPEVSPSVIGPVNAWQGKYGKRGGLRAFLIRTLQNAYPYPVSMTTLTDSLAGEFGILLNTRELRMRQQLSIRGQLRQLKEEGKVKPQGPVNSGSPGMWLWVADQMPSLGELAQRSAALSARDP